MVYIYTLDLTAAFSHLKVTCEDKDQDSNN